MMRASLFLLTLAAPLVSAQAFDPAIPCGIVDHRSVVSSAPLAGRVIAVVCLADWWMSWNAAQRLRRAGLRDVRWFAEGADGWRDLARPLTSQTPYEDRP